MSNIKEQIRQEIERQRSLIEGLFIEGDNSFYEGQDDAYNHLLAFIDSLPEEKPSENLNDEIKKFIEEYGYERGEDKLLIAIVARHFAEWQKKQMLKGALITDWNFNNGDKVRIFIVKKD